MLFLIKVIVTAFAVVIGAHIMPGVSVDTFLTAIVVAFVLGILNAILKPVLVILTLPVTVLSLGLFLLVINAFIIMLTDYFVTGFSVSTFWIAILFSIILSLISWLLSLPVRGRQSRGNRHLE
ncbi:MAG: phage holin family protein [Bacteroidetes bacterium]|nr:MAG: phage holin family protein [Bacteroidota bacterium]